MHNTEFVAINARKRIWTRRCGKGVTGYIAIFVATLRVKAAKWWRGPGPIMDGTLGGGYIHIMSKEWQIKRPRPGKHWLIT